MTAAGKRIFVAGHRGMVGRALLRRLRQEADVEIITRDRQQLDLLDQHAVRAFLQRERVDAIFIAAARVGGIHANNTYPAEFIHQNLLIACNLIDAAHRADVQRLLFLGSSCIYPRLAEQPMREEALLTGPLEPTNEPYAIAKIAGIKLCESYNRQHGRDYRSVMPTNLYGPHDNFHPENAHVIPALMRRLHEAKEQGAEEVSVWGSGRPRREFLHVDDLAEACFFLMQHYNERGFINIGVGKDISIKELALLIKEIVGYEGELRFDTSKPDGTPRKLLDISKLEALGFKAEISLEEGIRAVYEEYSRKT